MVRFIDRQLFILLYMQFKAQPNVNGALTHSLHSLKSVLIEAELYQSTTDPSIHICVVISSFRHCCQKLKLLDTKTVDTVQSVSTCTGTLYMTWKISGLYGTAAALTILHTVQGPSVFYIQITQKPPKQYLTTIVAGFVWGMGQKGLHMYPHIHVHDSEQVKYWHLYHKYMYMYMQMVIHINFVCKSFVFKPLEIFA